MMRDVKSIRRQYGRKTQEEGFYTQIGHGRGDSMWWVNDAENVVVRPSEPGVYHPNKDRYFWHGRYDAAAKVCSVVVPAHFEERTVPDYVLFQLEQEFPGCSIRLFHI